MRGSVIQGYFPNGLQRLVQQVERVQPVQRNATAQPKTACPACKAAQPRVVNGRPVTQPKTAAPVHHHNHPVVPANAAQQKLVQRMPNGTAVPLPATMNLPRGAGQPLPIAVRQKMESFFGTSFSDVRVHVGPEAASIGALAFTQGSDIHFAPGQYNPATQQGQAVLGHELTHVLQQRSGRVHNPFGSGVAIVQDHSMEAEAERMGQRAAAHSTGR